MIKTIKLLVFVSAMGASAVAGYFYRDSKGVDDTATRMKAEQEALSQRFHRAASELVKE